MARTATAAPPTSRGAATREKIVTAAAELVHGHGVAAMSLDRVREASDTSKSQLYHYFGDKDELVLAVIQRQAECVLEFHGAALARVTSLAGLRRWRDEVVQTTRRTHGAEGCPLGSLVPELSRTPRSRAALAASFADWEAQFAERLATLRPRAGRGSRQEVADLATTLVAALQGGLLLAQATRSTRPLELALDAALERIELKLRE